MGDLLFWFVVITLGIAIGSGIHLWLLVVGTVILLIISVLCHADYKKDCKNRDEYSDNCPDSYLWRYRVLIMFLIASWAAAIAIQII